MFHRLPSQDDEVQAAANDLGFRVVRYGEWRKLDSATGKFLSGDDWKLERAISKALHASP